MGILGGSEATQEAVMSLATGEAGDEDPDAGAGRAAS